MENKKPSLSWVEISATDYNSTLMMYLGEVVLVKEQVYNNHGDIIHTTLTSVQSEYLDIDIRRYIRSQE